MVEALTMRFSFAVACGIGLLAISLTGCNRGGSNAGPSNEKRGASVAEAKTRHDENSATKQNAAHHGNHKRPTPHPRHDVHHGGRSKKETPDHERPGGRKDGDTPRPKSEAGDHLANVDALAIFKRRILPIFQAKRPSSCTQCHLSGVELKDYIGADQAKTFATLRKQGLINVDDPDQSKILKFIRKKPKQPSLIGHKVRQQEYQAFSAWIHAAVKDPKLLAAKSDKPLGTELPPEVIRHARKDRVLASFIDNIWSEMGRCINCHSPERNRRQVKKFGEQVSWIAPRDPATTLQQLVDGENIDVDEPEQSPMLLKPAGLADHSGGQKFIPGGRTYKQFLRFLGDYAAVVQGKYRRGSDLPKPADEISFLTKQHLRIVGLPAKFDKMPLRVDLFRRLGSGWSKRRWATADGAVNGKRRQWQNLIAVAAPRNSERAKQIRKTPSLPGGNYLVKIYVDQNQKLRKNRKYELSDADFVAQIEIDGAWPPGYQPPKIIRAKLSD